MRDGKPFEEPFTSSGQEVFESGYKFNIVFQSQTEGYIYLFNEGRDESGKVGYYLLFPTPSVNNGSPQIIAGQQVQTAQNTFTGEKGTELIWMIWTKQQDDALARIVQTAYANRGEVGEANLVELQDLLKKFETSKPEVTKDSANQRTVLSAAMMYSSMRQARHASRIARIVLVAMTVGVFFSSPISASRAASAASMLQAGQQLQAPDSAGRMVILFDLVSLSGDELTRAIREVEGLVARDNEEPRVIAIATVRPALRVVSDFTADRAALRAILQSPDLLRTSASSLTAPAGVAAAGSDERTRSIARLCEVMAPITQRKAVIYFSGGTSGFRADNQSELRSATTGCARVSVSVYGVDARGLTAVVSGTGGGGVRFGR
jgi:hypothetical protein